MIEGFEFYDLCYKLYVIISIFRYILYHVSIIIICHSYFGRNAPSNASDLASDRASDLASVLASDLVSDFTDVMDIL